MYLAAFSYNEDLLGDRVSLSRPTGLQLTKHTRLLANFQNSTCLLPDTGIKRELRPVLFYFTFLVSQDRVSLCSPGCPTTQLIDQAGPKLRSACLCVPSAGIKGVPLLIVERCYFNTNLVVRTLEKGHTP